MSLTYVSVLQLLLVICCYPAVGFFELMKRITIHIWFWLLVRIIWLVLEIFDQWEFLVEIVLWDNCSFRCKKIFSQFLKSEALEINDGTFCLWFPHVCTICFASKERQSLLFLLGHVAIFLWLRLMYLVGIMGHLSIQYMSSGRCNRVRDIRFCSRLPFAFLWMLWLERNDRIYLWLCVLLGCFIRCMVY